MKFDAVNFSSRHNISLTACTKSRYTFRIRKNRKKLYAGAL